MRGDQDASGAANSRLSEADTEINRLAALSDAELRAAVAEHPDWNFPKKLNPVNLGPPSDSHATAIRTRLFDEWESRRSTADSVSIDASQSLVRPIVCILICEILAFLSAVPC